MQSIIADSVKEDGMRLNLLRQVVVSALVVLQVLLFSHLMSLNIIFALAVSLLFAIPVVFACRSLFSTQGFNTQGVNAQGRMRYAKMGAAMFAGGGIGMLLGCAADFGQLGLYGFLSLCQSNPLSFSFSGIALYWGKMQLTPWIYIGMFVGGNLGMLLLEERRTEGSPGRGHSFLAYLICNLGMLFGMVLAELLGAGVAALSNEFLAAGLMVLVMLLSMVAGMVLLLWATVRVTRLNLELRF